MIKFKDKIILLCHRFRTRKFYFTLLKFIVPITSIAFVLTFLYEYPTIKSSTSLIINAPPTELKGRNTIRNREIPDWIRHSLRDVRTYMEFGKYEKARIILMDILSVMGGDEEITRYLQHLYQLENEAAIAKLAGKIFPWPPPVASASARIPRSYLKQPDQKYVTLKDAAHKLNIALEKCGYYEKSYFWVPGGFALVTRMERIYPDGTPYENEDRWSAELNPLNKFSLVDIIKALFTANQGHFRIIVFIVSSRFNRMDTAKILTQKEAVQLLPTGWTDLPDFIGEMEYKELNYCRALIYEFVKQNNQEAVLKLPSDLQGPDHLRKAKIYMALKE